MRRDAAIRRTRRILHARTWAEATRYGLWHAPGSRSVATSPPLSWPLLPDELNDVVVRWPRRYAWSNAKYCVEPIRLGIARHIRLVPADIPQNPGNLVVFELARRSETLRVAIDYDDLPVLHPDAPRTDLYFKFQFRRGGYTDTNVVPGGYVSPKLSLYRHARRWRAVGEHRSDGSPVFARFSPTSDVRRELLETLRRAGWATDGVTAGSGSSWLVYMHDLSRAPICLDAPGRGEVCFRLVEALGAGACIVGPALEAELHVPTGDAVVRTRRDHDDLVETCERLLRDPVERANLRSRAADYFDRFLDLPQLGAYYMRSMLDA